MTKRRLEKKSPTTVSAGRRVVPMDLQVGDRLTDETGEWEAVGRPYTTNAGNAHARVKKVDQPEVTEIRSWGAHERITVKRAGRAEEGNR
jgi:hypothetical protein